MGPHTLCDENDARQAPAPPPQDTPFALGSLVTDERRRSTVGSKPTMLKKTKTGKVGAGGGVT